MVETILRLMGVPFRAVMGICATGFFLLVAMIEPDAFVDSTQRIWEWVWRGSSYRGNV